MKIVLIGSTYPFRGGISHYTSLLYRQLEKNHQVELISLRKQYPKLLFPGKTQRDESEKKIEVKSDPLIHPLYPWSWILTFSKIKKMSPDLTLFQWWHPYFAPCFGTLAILLKRWKRTKICFLCHNVKPHENTFIDTFLLKYAFSASDFFIVHSEPDLINLKKLKPGAKVSKAAHPIYDVFKFGKEMEIREAKRKLGIEGNVLLFFGYIRKYKGLEFLIRALPKVLREINCTLLIVGEVYGDKQEYFHLIDQSNAKDQIKWIGRYVPNEEVALYFTAADVVVLPYVSATQSGIIQIAYAFNKPVISTRVGGIPEAVVDGETGFIVDPGNADALAESILRFYKERATVDFSRNIEKVKEQFSWDRLVKVIERIYVGDA